MKRFLFLILFVFLFVTQAPATDLATLRPKGNAVVPSNAPILPSQAFVDNVIAFSAGTLAQNLRGYTFIDGEQLFSWAAQSDTLNGFTQDIDLSGNSLTVASVNGILAAMVAEGLSPRILDLSGGTNAAPTGQGITDKATLISAGWTVTTN